MSLVTVRLDDNLMSQIVAQAQVLHLSKSEYIRKAIEQMSAEIAKQERRESLRRASLCVREGSMRINQEFSKIEYDPDF